MSVGSGHPVAKAQQSAPASHRPFTLDAAQKVRITALVDARDNRFHAARLHLLDYKQARVEGAVDRYWRFAPMLGDTVPGKAWRWTLERHLRMNEMRESVIPEEAGLLDSILSGTTAAAEQRTALKEAIGRHFDFLRGDVEGLRPRKIAGGAMIDPLAMMLQSEVNPESGELPVEYLDYAEFIESHWFHRARRDLGTDMGEHPVAFKLRQAMIVYPGFDLTMQATNMFEGLQEDINWWRVGLTAGYALWHAFGYEETAIAYVDEIPASGGDGWGEIKLMSSHAAYHNWGGMAASWRQLRDIEWRGEFDRVDRSFLEVAPVWALGYAGLLEGAAVLHAGKVGFDNVEHVARHWFEIMGTSFVLLPTMLAIHGLVSFAYRYPLLQIRTVAWGLGVAYLTQPGSTFWATVGAGMSAVAPDVAVLSGAFVEPWAAGQTARMTRERRGLREMGRSLWDGLRSSYTYRTVDRLIGRVRNHPLHRLAG